MCHAAQGNNKEKMELSEYKWAKNILLTFHWCSVLCEDVNLKSNLSEFLHYFFQADNSVLLAIYWGCKRW